jgi:hypothetical protein
MKKILLIILVSLPLISHSQIPKKVVLTINSGIKSGTPRQTIESNVSLLLTRLNQAYIRNDSAPRIEDRILTTQGRKEINELWNDEHFYCYIDKISENLVKKDNSFQLRNIPVSFAGKDSVEIVVGFSSDYKIGNFYIGLNAHQYERILNGEEGLDETRRQIILNFIENFRNYYIKKDTENIEKLYSDKALIIIGKVLKPFDARLDQIKSNLTEKQVSLMVLTKDQYIKRLRSVFRHIGYLILDFDSIQVVKHKKHPDFYGVLLQQSWKASNYSDKGWLFLLVQFKEGKEPLIWVRTWQDVLNTPLDSVFGLHNFIIPSNGKVIY